MKQFDEDRFIERLIIPALIIFALVVWWLCSIPKAPHYEKIETTTKIVENSVENVEKSVIEETQPQYIEKVVTITAYCPCPKCTDGDGITSTGAAPKQGRTVAVDPKYIPYGTEIIIDGHSYIAEDCGGAIKGEKLDIFFDSHEKAKLFGVQKKVVKVML